MPGLTILQGNTNRINIFTQTCYVKDSIQFKITIDRYGISIQFTQYKADISLNACALPTKHYIGVLPNHTDEASISTWQHASRLKILTTQILYITQSLGFNL